jgi:hypothetical protein
MVRLDRQYIMFAGAALAAGLLSVSIANAQSVPDTTPLSYSAAEIFAKTLHDQTATMDETVWSDFSALAYAQSQRAAPAGAQWLPQPLPAVDGLNGKIDGYGGGANHISSLYGADGSLSIPLAQQWGAQIDGGIGSFNNSGTSFGTGHLFWRDPSVGLLGAYGSYAHWNGISGVILPPTGANIARYAAEGEYYWGRWTFRSVAGYETVRFNIPAVVPGVPAFSIPNRFFDSVRASYYVTDDFKLSIGHVYTVGRNALTLGSEYGFALGGGRMASLFANGSIGETGLYAARAGLRIYFGQRDKTLINRNRQDDPDADDDEFNLQDLAYMILGSAYRQHDVQPASSRSAGTTTPGTTTTTPGTTTPGTTTPGTVP